MEVVVTEEKKKIFRARKTMKISDRQQLETLHSTLSMATSSSSEASPPPLVNGTHKEDGPKMGDKELNNISDSSTTHAPSPSSLNSPSSPVPFLSLNLSPSPASSQSPEPSSPLDSIKFELKKMDEDEEGEKKSSLSVSSTETAAPASTESKDNQQKDTEEKEKKQGEQTAAKDTIVAKVSVTGLVPCSSVPLPESDCLEPVDTDNDTKDSEAFSDKIKEEKPAGPKSTTSDSSLPYSPSSRSQTSAGTDLKQETEIKEEKEKDVVKKGLTNQAKMEVDVKVETKKEKSEVGQSTKPSRPSSTPPSNTVQEDKGSTSGLKRTLSDSSDKAIIERKGKKPKLQREELEAQLELKITAGSGTHPKLEKIVQQLVEDRLKALQSIIFDKHFEELKNRVDKIDCAAKHQTAINTIQAKIARLSKKFGEANQASENKRKQEALAAAAAATAAATATAAAATATRTAAVPNSTQAQRPVRTSMEVKQAPTTISSSSTAVNPTLPTPPAPTVTPFHTPTSTAMVTQTPILQLITSTSNAASSLAPGITTQSPTATLVLKTAPGTSMMASGQPLLFQLPLSVTNGQAGTLVNIPVSSLSSASSLNKAKTTAPTTFILKPASSITTAPAAGQAVATVPSLQAPPSQMPSTQISLARTVYQGGAGGITTPNAGISVTTARTPAQSVSVAGAMSTASSPATSGPAATGSTAPGPPQGTSLTSKTDNQASASGSTPSKVAAPTTRPKGSVIDLTEDDDDVQVTGVKTATAATSSPVQRPYPVISIPSTVGARASPQSNHTSPNNPQLTVHHRPPPESVKSRNVNTNMAPRVSNIVLPPLPAAPAPPRLPPEAERTSAPQQPQLKLVPSQTGIVLSWCVAETDRTCADVDSYHLYAFHQDSSSSNAAQQLWKKIGEVKALPLPMACTLTQFQSGSTYHFAVRAKDIYGRFGSFCEPQCTNVISSSSS